MAVAKRLEGIGEYYFSQKLREIDEMNRQGRQVINLGIGSPDLPPHPSVIKTLQEESARPNVHAYQSYKGSPVLRKAIGEWYERWYGVTLDPDTEVLPLIGSKEGIMHICMTYFEAGVAVLVPNPGYPTYSSAVKLSGAQPLYYSLREENGYEPDFEEWERLIDEAKKQGRERVGGIFVNYPHMPTGQLPSASLFEKIVTFGNQHQLLIIHDNPYSFILNESPMSLLATPGAMDCVIELNSLSKSHNMAGWRVGMLCAAKQRIDEVLRFKSNMDSGMFLPVQLAAAKALSLGKEWQEEVNGVYRARREKVFQLLELLNCSFSRQQAGLFVWAKPGHSVGADHPLGQGGSLSDEILYNANVFITPGGIFGSAGEDYIRVSLCATVEKFDEAISRMRASLKNAEPGKISIKHS
jgi:aspartate/methionine/tyrosine aminotransferase